MSARSGSGEANFDRCTTKVINPRSPNLARFGRKQSISGASARRPISRECRQIPGESTPTLSVALGLTHDRSPAADMNTAASGASASRVAVLAKGPRLKAYQYIPPLMDFMIGDSDLLPLPKDDERARRTI